MMTRLSATAADIGEVKEFIRLAETLGYDDDTLVGNHHTGLDLFIELPVQSSSYGCDDDSCKFRTVKEAMGLTADRQFIMPHHSNGRGYTCSGSGKEGKPTP